MPLIHDSYDSLPYVDAPPTEASLAAATAMIEAEIRAGGDDTTQYHPALELALQYEPKFSPLVEQEHARLQTAPTSKLNAIDLKRYTEVSPPENTDPTSDEDKPELLEKWNVAMKQAYTSSEYVNSRLTELGLLERFGKNAWLISNSQLEDVLKRIETELADVKKQHEETEAIRRAQQEAVAGEIMVLEENWKRGVGRVLETEVAAEGLKEQILEKRRAGAV